MSTAIESEPEVVLEVEGVAKSFGAIQALRDASLRVTRGSVHALAGENGAGKSTLLKALAGQYRTDTGTIRVCGRDYLPSSVLAARDAGIGIVFQETMLQPRLTVAENLMGSDYRSVGRAGVLSWRRMRARAKAMLAPIDPTIDVDVLAGDIGLGTQRLVELAAAVARKPDLLLIDEITASLDADEIGRFFEVVKGLRDRGNAVVYVSHHLDEIFQVCDEVTVLRDGRVVGHGAVADLTEGKLSSMMVGREISHRDVASTLTPDLSKPIMSLSGLASEPSFRGLDLDIHPGEIVGIAGLQGAGAESILETIFGLRQQTAGTMHLDGELYKPRRPHDAIAAGIALVPKERDVEGVIGTFSMRRNVTLPIQSRIARGPWVTSAAEREVVAQPLASVGVRPFDPELPCDALSGGNRQKVVIAKWLATKPRLVLLNNPTRGVDVGAKDDVYQLLGGLAAEGIAMVVVSEELQELIGLCRRILVMKRGEMNGGFGPEDDRTEDSLVERML